MTFAIFWHEAIINFLDVVSFLLSSLVTGPSFLSISSLVLELWEFPFIRDRTRNPKIGNTPILVLSNIWRLGRVRNAKFGTNVFDKMLMNVAKCQGFRLSQLLRENQSEGKITPNPPTTQVRVKQSAGQAK